MVSFRNVRARAISDFGMTYVQVIEEKIRREEAFVRSSTEGRHHDGDRMDTAYSLGKLGALQELKDGVLPRLIYIYLEN